MIIVGFLSTTDENSPGNYGILDQAMALRWVYENIKAFNGDREKITLFGPGAGAASAGLLMVAPRYKIYFGFRYIDLENKIMICYIFSAPVT